MTASTSDVPTLPGLPVHVVAAGTLEPGDLLLSPGITRPTRVWWRLGEGPLAVVLLAGTRHAPPARLTVAAADPATVVGRGIVLERAEQTHRVLCACRGGRWLTRQQHPQAPTGMQLALLVDALGRLTDLSTGAVQALIDAELPPSP